MVRPRLFWLLLAVTLVLPTRGWSQTPMQAAVAMQLVNQRSKRMFPDQPRRRQVRRKSGKSLGQRFQAGRKRFKLFRRQLGRKLQAAPAQLTVAAKAAPGKVAKGTKATVKWVKENPKAAATLALGTAATIYCSTTIAPEIKEALGGGFAGYVIGGGVSSAARSLLVNGGLQRITRGKGKMDLRELAADVSLSAVGGVYGFGAAELLGKGAQALQLAGAAKTAYNFVGLAGIETFKDGYQIAIRNVARRKAGNAPKGIAQGMKECFVAEAITGAPRVTNPKSYPLKLVSDLFAAGLYYFIVNPDKKAPDPDDTPHGQALINN